MAFRSSVGLDLTPKVAKESNEVEVGGGEMTGGEEDMDDGEAVPRRMGVDEELVMPEEEYPLRYRRDSLSEAEDARLVEEKADGNGG